jgi:hypothetical protein
MIFQVGLDPAVGALVEVAVERIGDAAHVLADVNTAELRSMGSVSLI